jgi:hypothetical protein
MINLVLEVSGSEKNRVSIKKYFRKPVYYSNYYLLI